MLRAREEVLSWRSFCVSWSAVMFTGAGVAGAIGAPVRLTPLPGAAWPAPEGAGVAGAAGVPPVAPMLPPVGVACIGPYWRYARMKFTMAGVREPRAVRLVYRFCVFLSLT